jgi:RNA recognition motif-containing protein
MSRVTVQNLTRNVGEAHLKEIFGTFGEIKESALDMDERRHVPKGVGVDGVLVVVYLCVCLSVFVPVSCGCGCGCSIVYVCAHKHTHITYCICNIKYMFVCIYATCMYVCVGTAVVEYESREEAEKAIAAMDGAQVWYHL